MHRKILAAATILCAFLIAGAAQATLVISTAPTNNVTCTAGVCTTTAADAVLNVHQLAASLQRQDTTISATVPIELDAPMHWTSAHLLSLDSSAITFTQPVISEGGGGVKITTGKNGDFYFTGDGRIAFWNTSSALVINARPYRLIRGLPALIAAIAAHEVGRFALADNYDASVDGTYSYSPVHTEFAGTLEGLGNSISHLSMACCGLFYSLYSFNPASAVRDIALVGVVLRSTTAYRAGALVGWNFGAAIIGVSVSGTVSAGNGQPRTPGAVGGVVGLNDGYMLRAHSSVRVSCGAFCYVGGVAGENQFSIIQSGATGSVRGGKNASAGGLVGHNLDVIDLSFATGAVSVGDTANSRPTRDAMAGGLIGFNEEGRLTRAYATGPVTGGSGVQQAGNHVWVGGLVGGGGAGQDCYATGSASVGNQGVVGGLLGGYSIAGTWECYSTTAVSVTGGSALMGGFVGEDTGAPHFPYDIWDLDTSNVSDPSKGAGNVSNDPSTLGLTTAQLQSGLPAGFEASVWGQNPAINNGLPYLLQNPPQ